MAPEDKEDTIKAYVNRYGNNDFVRVMEIFHPPSNDAFVDRLYSELNAIIRNIEETAAVRQTDGEDRLTLDIVLNLRRAGYTVSHDAYVNGHADISVTQDNFRWLGEAKEHRDYEWLFKGLRQLLSRYATGREDGSALLVYIKNKDAANVLAEWRKRLTETKECELQSTNDSSTGEKLVFWSTHKHNGSGLPIKTKHLGISLYFQPTDSVPKSST